MARRNEFVRDCFMKMKNVQLNFKRSEGKHKEKSRSRIRPIYMIGLLEYVHIRIT